MKQASIPLYIRFGEIPNDESSKVHRGDAIIRKEGGVSVWRAVESDGIYYPILPVDFNKNAISDYFNLLLKSNKRVYLVTGDELSIEGADREPLLNNIKILKEITNYYRDNNYKED